jgi:hypothetical protein
LLRVLVPEAGLSVAAGSSAQQHVSSLLDVTSRKIYVGHDVEDDPSHRPILSESELSYFRRKTFLRMSGQNSWKA